MVDFYPLRLSKYLLTTLLQLLCMLTGICRSYAQTETFPTNMYTIHMGITPKTDWIDSSVNFNCCPENVCSTLRLEDKEQIAPIFLTKFTITPDSI